MATTRIDDRTALLYRDFREVALAGCIDTIITDPPYAREYAWLWPELAKWADRALKPGGSILSIVPHYLLPEVLHDFHLDAETLKYRWMIAMVQSSGSHPRMAMGVEVCWKPVVWWVKRAWPQGRGYVRDAFPNDPPDKEHEWEQSIDWARAMLKFNPPGGIVCDPMMGAGTVGAACREAGVPFIGIDNARRAYDLAVRNLSDKP